MQPSVGRAPGVLQIALNAAREESDKLFSVIRSGSIHERPIAQRHRLIFYLGHLEAFDWNQIAAGKFSAERFNPTFDKLFEAGIDPDSNSLPSDRPSDWPALYEVHAYCKRVRLEIDRLLPKADARMIQFVIEHRMMHAETLAYLIHSLPFDRKSGPGLGPMPVSTVSAEQPVSIPSGVATLGKERDLAFGWDNEFEEHRVEVPQFSIDRHKVTNRQYQAFVRDGAAAPHFWTKERGRWCGRGMFGLAPLALDAPVYVTQQEASAYAKWAGKHLPSESQFHRAAYGTHCGVEREYPWGSSDPLHSHGNFDFHYWDPISVNATPAGDSDFGVSQLVGNGWEWTSTVFAPFPGFRPDPNYPGYSANFFDGEHYVMKGASPRTAKCLLRRSFRNWFRPDYPYVFAAFRCVENA